MVNIGIIGAGFMGGCHFGQYEKLAARARVVALCDQEANRRAGDWSGVGGNIGDTSGRQKQLAGVHQYARWHDLVADPDVQLVDVCIPTPSHPEVAIAALDAGKHVLCEKPMALSVPECDRMLAAAESAPGRFMIAQCIRFWPQYVFLRQAAEDGRYGPLQALSLRRQAATPDYSWHNWIVDPGQSGGAVLDLHVHDVDFALALLGRPRSVTATGYHRASGAVDRVHALWHFDRELSVYVEGFWDAPRGFKFNMGYTAVFEGATLCWDLNAGKPVTVLAEGAEEQLHQVPDRDGYYGEIDYFLGCIERQQDPQLSTPRDSRAAVAIALAEKQSLETNRPVSIEL